MSINHPQPNKRPSEKYPLENITKILGRVSPELDVEAPVALRRGFFFAWTFSKSSEMLIDNNSDPTFPFSLPLPRPHKGGHSQGAFNNARNFVVNHPVFAESIHVYGGLGDQSPIGKLPLSSGFLNYLDFTHSLAPLPTAFNPRNRNEFLVMASFPPVLFW